MFPVKDAENRVQRPPKNMTHLALHAGRKPTGAMLLSILDDAEYIQEEIIDYCLNYEPLPYSRGWDRKEFERLDILLAGCAMLPDKLYPVCSAVIGIMTVEDVLPPTQTREHHVSPWQALGHWTVVGKTVMLENPVPCRGAQGFWKLDELTRATVNLEWKKAK
jgi:hypothetical protein